jgi:SAM-dependent methyltransferase
MGERGGLWSVLEHPRVYEALATVLGVRRLMRSFTDTTVGAKEGDVVLDIGCGPGALLRYLNGATYIGIDYSERNIAQARREHGSRGRFICGNVVELAAHQLPPIDIAVAYGVLHHLDDEAALRMLHETERCLRPGGRLIALDPCFHPDQTFAQRFVNSKDRGAHVRQFSENVRLVRSVFSDAQADLVCGHLPLPHSVCIIQAEKRPLHSY